ncbi:MAG: BREX-1 system adenine-specific DNA-methyltransferase PglX, partial [Acidobacteria bacterium]|nr:BREX-1 system adenine-specific DNA-methyltransferase PglX [Acidobacteriota bacterium]
YHAALYRSRPIFWHISSRQGKSPAAFSALVHYHRFDKDRMAKLRGVYLREALTTFRREAALASQAGRAEDRLEWQAKVEEAEELDRRLQKVQEGFHEGAEDYRILTPWKSETARPKGWDPDINDGVKVNIEPLQRAGVLRIAEVV